MADWVGKANGLLTPLIGALREHVFAADRLHGDDTPVPVLEPGKGSTKTGRLWTYLRDGRPWADSAPPAVCYFYSPDRKGEHPRGHLATFRGVLHADGYAGFRELDTRINLIALFALVKRNAHSGIDARLTGQITASIWSPTVDFGSDFRTTDRLILRRGLAHGR
jgi:hypothetical protein